MLNILGREHQTYYLSFLEDIKNVTLLYFPGEAPQIKNCHFESYLNYTELIENFISSCEVILDWPIFSENQKRSLEYLYEMILDFDDNYDEKKKTDDEIRNDPEWDKIQQYAKIIYADLKNVKFT